MNSSLLGCCWECWAASAMALKVCSCRRRLADSCWMRKSSARLISLWQTLCKRRTRGRIIQTFRKHYGPGNASPGCSFSSYEALAAAYCSRYWFFSCTALLSSFFQKSTERSCSLLRRGPPRPRKCMMKQPGANSSTATGSSRNLPIVTASCNCRSISSASATSSTTSLFGWIP